MWLWFCGALAGAALGVLGAYIWFWLYLVKSEERNW